VPLVVVVLVVVVVTCSGSINGSTPLFNLSTTKQLWHSTRCIVSAVWFTNLVGDCAVDNDFTEVRETDWMPKRLH
jgi:hypothetical protein